MSYVKRAIARLEASSVAISEILRDTIATFGSAVAGVFIGPDSDGFREVYVEFECDEEVMGLVIEKLKSVKGLHSLKVRDVDALIDFASAWRKAF
ncbi:MAG: hypothetical protein NZ988_02335 [Thaumarchaeota archaeon]|nr:hypothetical protein [Candidatus Calditenuaceae archaeon]MDW8186873.1 hypothetical protein [Nitrososphaerota archaeon]